MAAPLDSLEEAVVSGDVFRVTREPAVVRLRASDAGDGSGPSAAYAAPRYRPALVLRAIVGGPPWQAIIDGIPGQSVAVALQPGQRIDRLRISSVTRDSVVVVGPDTVWVLSFRSMR